MLSRRWTCRAIAAWSMPSCPCGMGSENSMVIRFSWRKPGLVEMSRRKLRPSRPAPTRMTSVVAISPMTKRLRNRWLALDAV